VLPFVTSSKRHENGTLLSMIIALSVEFAAAG
jgi:hypothetical protein